MRMYQYTTTLLKCVIQTSTFIRKEYFRSVECAHQNGEEDSSQIILIRIGKLLFKLMLCFVRTIDAGDPRGDLSS